MNRSIARTIHRRINNAYWYEHPEWSTDNPLITLESRALRALPFSMHALCKSVFYNQNVIAVNGESVVAVGDAGTVDKFMFRYPGKMSTREFKGRVSSEVGAVTSHLSGVALPTGVSIKPARIFRSPQISVEAVAQTQARLDLYENPPLKIYDVIGSQNRDITAKGLEALIIGSELMAKEDGLYPDVAVSSGNLRRSVLTGEVTLIDVMPVYANGERLIDDGANILPATLETLENFKKFVGRFGA